ncbi:MAG: PucR family transcriptional regulator ligand-binding domain-containing protein [Acholeplasmataceae bacterium]|nr:PucR family transcriptional regulator ligand-binding domain-containing protein [Acholeplasmataceae bacterium]
MIKLSQLLKINVIESYEVLTGKTNLDRLVSSVSVLETPEFEKYVIENSLILTTLYPIKEDVALFNKLLDILDKKNSSGIIVKIHRYVESIPKEIIEKASLLNFPIITIDYDANLSTVFNSILSEIQGSEYNRNNLTPFYTNILNSISDNPSTEALVESAKDIADLEVLIFNPVSKKLHCSNEVIRSYYEKYSHPTNTLVKDKDLLLYVTNIEYGNEIIYRIALLTTEEKRYLLYNYAEIYKMLAIFVFQKKREIFMRQNQFLLGFVSNITSNYNTNEELMEVSQFYNWDVKFPLFLMLFSIKGEHNPQQSVYCIQSLIIELLEIPHKTLRYIVMDDLILFIVNTTYESNILETIELLYARLEIDIPNTKIKLAYSNPIDQAHEIPKVFAILSKTVTNANRKNIDLSIFNENHVRLISLLKSLNYEELHDFSISIIGRLLDYEKKTNLPLMNTIYKYIQCRFSIKKTADALYIHTNSLKYRLSVIEKLGYRINNIKSHFFDFYLALYVQINLLEDISDK